MPSTEYIHKKNTRHNVTIVEQCLKVLLLFTCPVCRRYTIHKPRIDYEGSCFVDHKRLPLYQTTLDGSDVFMGFVADDACFVAGAHPLANIEMTRTVIRVK